VVQSRSLPRNLHLTFAHLSSPLLLHPWLPHLSQYDTTSHSTSPPSHLPMVKSNRSRSTSTSTQQPRTPWLATWDCDGVDPGSQTMPSPSFLPITRLLRDIPSRLACKSRTWLTDTYQTTLRIRLPDWPLNWANHCAYPSSVRPGGFLGHARIFPL